MRDLVNVEAQLHILGCAPNIINMATEYAGVLPGGQKVLSDKWEVIEWVLRPGNSTSFSLDFSVFKNEEIKLCVKICILSRRFSKKIAANTASCYIYANIALDREVGSKKVMDVVSEDFYGAERSLLSSGSGRYPMYLKYLQAFCIWMSRSINPRLLYRCPSPSALSYGREGNEEGRRAKLISDEVMSDLFSLAGTEGLPVRDRFYLCALVINTVIQGRVNELATMPKDCVVENEGLTSLIVYSEKNGFLNVRTFPQVLVSAVRNAVDFIVEHTNEGRAIAARLRMSQTLDWNKIIANELALRYFSKKFASVWVTENVLIDPDAVWASSLGKKVDANGILRKAKFSTVTAANDLGVSYRTLGQLVERQEAAKNGYYLLISGSQRTYVTEEMPEHFVDVRRNPGAISVKVMSKFLEIDLFPFRTVIADILDAALKCQLSQRSYSMVTIDEKIESHFFKTMTPVVKDSGNKIVLEPEQALFIVPENYLTTYTVRSNKFTLLTHNMFREWLTGAAKKGDSLFSKYNVIDPATGDVAAFKWHDVRHWFQTVYKRGGLTDLQANMLAGRRVSDQIGTYDHRSVTERTTELAELRNAVRSGVAVGTVAETFNVLRIVDEPEAELYLSAATVVTNRMPHGICTLNIAQTPCPHHLSCFVKGSEGSICNELLLDGGDQRQVNELMRLLENSKGLQSYLVSLGGEGTSQFRHFQRVEQNLVKILGKFSALRNIPPASDALEDL